MKMKLFTTLFLIFTTVVAGFTFLMNGSNIIGVDFYESEEIISQRESFLDDLVRYEINALDFEQLRASIRITEDEINYYRDYYGSLPGQLENIRSQYASLFEQEQITAEDRKFYEEERDKKLEEVRKNFESDEAVEQKILAIKERALEKYKEAYERGLKAFENEKKYFGYQLKNENGDIFKSEMDSIVADRLVFKEGNGWYIEGKDYIDLSSYLSGEPGIQLTTLAQERPYQQLTGEVMTYQSILNQHGLEGDQTAFEIRKILFYTIWVLGIVSLVLLLTVYKIQRETFSWPSAEILLEKLPLDIRIIIPLFSGILFLSLLKSLPYELYRLVEYVIPVIRSILIGETVWMIAMTFVSMCIFILTIIWLADAIKEHGIKADNSLFVRLAESVKESFLNKSIGKQTFAMFIVFFFGGMGFAGVLIVPPLLLIYIPLFMFVLLPITYIYFKRMGYLNKVMKQTEAMASGELTAEVEVKGKSPIAKHAANLNDVRKGIEISVKEQAKSERLKSELITNVSHDLRTPLTSIITYTDLLKNPDLTVEERVKYVDILDRKSGRLKTLIEDLFEVSKMASGNIEIIQQRVDLAQMLQQTVAEHEEDFIAAGLDLRMTIQEPPIYAHVDGQKWWRVVDNLLINARKYSMTGTRVYVTLKETKGIAEFTVKNVAKYELGGNIEELTERFKRADTSRHTEGSGLGLAIAQSIVDLHGGQLVLEVDGDLFKAIVKIHTV